MSFGIIVRNYEHYNRSFKNWNSPKGRYIKSKADYEKALAQENMIPFEKAQQIVAQKERERENTSYSGISKKALGLIKSVQKDKNGKIKMSDRQIEAMKEVGVQIKMPDWLPNHYKDKEGGFDASQK